MKDRFYKKLYALYFSLNDSLLQSLKDFTQEESNGQYTLISLIEVYATTCHHSPVEYRNITMLHNTNSISDLETFYDYISDMLFMIK